MNHHHHFNLVKTSILVILLLLIPSGVWALASFSGGNVSIVDPVADDVFAAGGTIDVNAPVDSLTAAGGTITINAPVKGDVIAAGGRVIVNNNVGGKIIAAGGNVDVNGDIGTNAVIYGGKVIVNPRVTIGRDAAITGGEVITGGKVLGNLSVKSDTLEDTGTVGGFSTYVKPDHRGFKTLLTILGILFTIGWFILGLILLKVAPARYQVVENEVRTATVVKLVVGFVGLIVACIGVFILCLTIIGLPLALVIGLLCIMAVLLSVFFVSSALGSCVLSWLKAGQNPWYAYIIGFVILNLLFRVPFVGVLILIIVVSIGFGALLYAIHDHWKSITGNAPVSPP